MRFSAKYLPTSLFSLKDSNSTNSGAKALFLPSPYAIKMAIINQAITIDGNFIENLTKSENKQRFEIIRDTQIAYFIPPAINFCVNNSFVKILKLKEDKRGQNQKNLGIEFEPGFQQTVAFREYVYISGYIEIIFEVKSEEARAYLKKYLHRINYFGKKGCFFQFLEYPERPSNPNVFEFGTTNASAIGILQQYDDFDEKATFAKVNSYSKESVKRKKRIFVLPIEKVDSSKSFSQFTMLRSLS